MRKPRFRLWKLMLFVPFAAILSVAGYDLITGFGDGSGADPLSAVIFFAVISALPCGSVGLFIFVVFLTNRGTPPPR